jgi:hypothetical protein
MLHNIQRLYGPPKLLTLHPTHMYFDVRKVMDMDLVPHPDSGPGPAKYLTLVCEKESCNRASGMGMKDIAGVRHMAASSEQRAPVCY